MNLKCAFGFFIFLNFYSFLVEAQFQNQTEVLQTKTGTGSFGWAVATLKDINDDSVNDYVVGAIGANTATVYSGSDGQLLYTFSMTNSNFGYAVADAGDVDGDGLTDIIVGGPSNANSKGISVVYSGATGLQLWSFEGESVGDRFGAAVSSAGDVNNDGRSDLLIGADSNDAQGNNSGRVYVYSGLDGQLIRNLEAESSFDRFGGGTGLLGDVNNDGIKDHIIGAYAAGATSGGKAYVYSGSDGSALFELNPDMGANVFGQFFVANAGDVDNDGIEDIYVGDYNHGGGAGRVYIFSGDDQHVIYRFSGSSNPAEGAGPGRSAGDVNNDGHSDIIVGFYTGAASQAGRTTVFSGKDGSVLQNFIHTISNSQLGFDAVGIGDVNNDSMFDFLVTAANGNIVYVLAGETERAPEITINSGLSGAWFNRSTSGQGILIEVLPTQKNIFLAYFTFDQQPDTSGESAIIGDINHRWLTAFGGYQNNIANLNISVTRGGLFNNSAAVASSAYGTITLTFHDCEKATLTFNLLPPRISGSYQLSRIANDNVAMCEMLSQQ